MKVMVNINKNCQRFSLYIPKKIREKFKKGENIEITLPNNKVIISKFNYNVTIRKSFIGNFKPNQNLEIKIKKMYNIKRSKQLFYKNKIDLLYLIPKTTSNSYEILVTEFSKRSEKWLRCWYSHERGSGRQLEIKRFIDIKKFGNLLGQYQAEGTKNLNDKYLKYIVEFKNKLLKEHSNFLGYLKELGIQKEEFTFSINSNKNNKRNAEILANQFECINKVKVSRYISNGTKGIGISSIVRNTILFEIISNSMNKIRHNSSKNIKTNNEKILASAFLSKLLTGDGTLDIRINNREYEYPSVRIKITDGNLEYLKDYAEIMKKLKFKPHINEKHIHVRSYCTLENLLYLYKKRAFEHTNNWYKLLIVIGLYLNGRRFVTNYRFLDLSNIKTFTSVDISKKYNVSISAANDWLNNKEKEGLIRRIKDNTHPIYGH